MNFNLKKFDEVYKVLKETLSQERLKIAYSRDILITERNTDK